MSRYWRLFPLLLAACGDDGGSTPPADAPVDVAPIAGNYACSGQPLATTAPDPLSVNGGAIDWTEAGIGGATVEIHAVDDDRLLGSTTSSTTVMTRGRFSVNVATGGTAFRTYRKLALTDRIDAYGYDPRPAHAGGITTILFTAAELDRRYQTAGVTRDPSKGTVWIDISDCTPSYVTGAATVDSPSGRVFYLDDQLEIDPALTANVSGAVMVLNVDPGEHDIVVHAGPVTYVSWPVKVYANALTQSDRMP